MKKQTSLTAALGSAFLASVAFSLPAAAADGAFGARALSTGYQLAAADEAKAPEGKCGAGKQAMAEGTGGEKKADGQCGASKKVEKKKDGKCSEGKCSDNKKK